MNFGSIWRASGRTPFQHMPQRSPSARNKKTKGENHMLEPIVKTIEVPCSQEKAFRVFVNDMGSWWPLDKRSMSMKAGHPAKSLHVEAKLGGKIVEIGHDGTEHFWGTFKTFNPHESVSMNFHMGMPPENAAWWKSNLRRWGLSGRGSNSHRAI